MPEGILVNSAIDQDAEPHANEIGDIEAQSLPNSDSEVSQADTEEQGEPDFGAAEETADRGEGDADTMESQTWTGSGSTSSSGRAPPRSVSPGSFPEESKTGASAEGEDRDSGDRSQDAVPGDDFPTGADVPFIERISKTSNAHARPEGKEVLALTLTIRNKVNGSYVQRPENLGAEDKWAMEYSLDEVSNPDRAWSLYQACQMRRRKKLDEVNHRTENDEEVDFYIKRLRKMSRKGAEWRKKQDETDRASPVKVLGQAIQQDTDNET